MALRKKHCEPCEKGTPPLTHPAAKRLLRQAPGWRIDGKHRLVQRWSLRDFEAGVQLINQIAKIAEREDHHPDLHLTGYRHLTIELSTHSIGGLSLNDFIVAAKISALPKRLAKKA